MARAILAHRAQRRAEDAVDEARAPRRRRTPWRSRPPRRSRPRRGIGRSPSTRSGCSISSSATRRIARSSGAMRSSVQPLAWRSMRRVELVGVVGRRVRERAREGRGVALEDVVERAARSGRAGRARRPPPGAGRTVGTARSRAGHVRARARVHLDPVADVHEQRHADGRAGLQRGGLVAAARRGVAAHARLGVRDLELDRRARAGCPPGSSSM